MFDIYFFFPSQKTLHTPTRIFWIPNVSLSCLSHRFTRIVEVLLIPNRISRLFLGLVMFFFHPLGATSAKGNEYCFYNRPCTSSIGGYRGCSFSWSVGKGLQYLFWKWLPVLVREEKKRVFLIPFCSFRRPRHLRFVSICVVVSPIGNDLTSAFFSPPYRP